MTFVCDLANKQCVPCEGGTHPLSPDEVITLIKGLDGWVHHANRSITKNFEFKDYYQTMSFVNAVAWISHRENHHPDLTVRYNQCRVEYSTHAIDALSENDFICAAKVDVLLKI